MPEKNPEQMRISHYTVVIIGSGFGGQCAAIRLKEQQINDFIILEKSNFPGGTWCQNSYPGAAVDVQSPLYSISSEPYDWSQMFCTQAELERYTHHLLNKHHLAKKIKLNTSVVGLDWKEPDNRWKLTTNSGWSCFANFVINATGPLSDPALPDFVGQDRFKGHSFHTSQWDHQFDYRGKRVAVVGSGASAAQVIPAIANDVSELHVFQRTPHWVMPRPDYKFRPWQRKMLSYQWISKCLRFAIYWGLETRIVGFKYSRFLLTHVGQRAARRHIAKQINNPALRKRVTPDYALGCKRILLSNRLYPTYNKSHVKLHSAEDDIKEFTESGIVTREDTEIAVDLVVYATGFDTNEKIVAFPVNGKNGMSISRFWNAYPRAYLGTTLPLFPNFFIVLGPNTAIGHTSAIFMIESQMKYIIDAIKSVTSRGLSTIEVTRPAEAEYTARIHREMKKTVWNTGGCDSWYKDKAGRVIAIFPGFSFNFKRMTSKFRLDHHHFS